MLKIDAQSSIKKLQSQCASLSPNALISLFIIDVTDIALDIGVINSIDIQNKPNLGLFRFHNNIKLFNSDIYWQGNTYKILPIEAIGFEYSSEGTLPRPKIALTVSDQSVPELTRLKTYLLQIGDLVGAKFTRIRTFAKYLDAQNFINEISFNESEPDPYAEFPREVYYFDRKSKEDKFSIEYELATIFDLEGLKLPGRLVISNVCAFQYRGAGCLYEFKDRKT
ncbi:MAG: phage minor tail protein L, partial [Nanoarchaeota archaeon]